ncbi:plasmid replication initiator TrfA [Desulfotalea psychrophila]|nr:plasmid replication initiator TrfA [Desulfotalea psychrophila]
MAENAEEKKSHYLNVVLRDLGAKLSKRDYDSWCKELTIECSTENDLCGVTLIFLEKAQAQYFEEQFGEIVRKALPSEDVHHIKYELTKQPVQLFLPNYGESYRHVPNEFTRSALFAVGAKKIPRRLFKNEVIPVIGDNVSITYTGEELRQDDEDVWLQLIFLCILSDKAIDDSPTIEFTPRYFCKIVGWPVSGYYYTKLEKVIERLKVTGLKVSARNGGDKVSNLSLIRKYYIRKGAEEDSVRLKTWQVWLEPEIVRLFARNSYTTLEWDMRMSFKSALSKWLHGYYKSHQKPFPVKIETLMKGCGSKMTCIRNFKKELLKSLEELKKAGFLAKWEVNPKTDIVTVTRT